MKKSILAVLVTGLMTLSINSFAGNILYSKYGAIGTSEKPKVMSLIIGMSIGEECTLVTDIDYIGINAKNGNVFLTAKCSNFKDEEFSIVFPNTIDGRPRAARCSDLAKEGIDCKKSNN